MTAAPLRATADWTASYADPVSVAAGDPLRLSGAVDLWDGWRWLWARAADGREGWIPDDLPVPDGDGWRAAAAFCAMELTCRAGEPLTGLERRHGWTRCRNRAGAEGWVPDSRLAPATGDHDPA